MILVSASERASLSRHSLLLALKNTLQLIHWSPCGGNLDFDAKFRYLPEAKTG